MPPSSHPATILLIETQTVTYLAATAASSADPRQLSGTLLHSVGGLVVLLVTVIPSVFEPRRVTRYGWRKQNELRQATQAICDNPLTIG